MRRLAGLAAAFVLVAPSTAAAPTATVNFLHFWQAKRIVRDNALELRRPGFRVERARRVDGSKVRVCWSEPGYLSPAEGRDFGCDVVELRGRQFWLRDDSTGGTWARWL